MRILDLWKSLFAHTGKQQIERLRLRTGEVSDEETIRVVKSVPTHFLANSVFRFGPVALTNTLTTNILNPPTTTGGVGISSSYANTFIILRNIRIVNKHASIPATFNLYIDATGGNTAGKELAFTIPVPVGGEYNISPPGGIYLSAADFLVGGSNTATALTIEGHGEIGLCK